MQALCLIYTHVYRTVEISRRDRCVFLHGEGRWRAEMSVSLQYCLNFIYAVFYVYSFELNTILFIRSFISLGSYLCVYSYLLLIYLFRVSD